MKTPFVFYLVLALSAVLSQLALPAQGQTYSFSAPVTGSCDLDVMDYSDFSSGQFAHATSQISLNTLTETMYYDPVNQTLRQVGSVSLNGPANVSLSFVANAMSPQTGTASVTVDFSFPAVLSFDTTCQSLSGANNEFILAPPTIPVTGIYSILAGGQTLTGSFDYSLYFPSLVTDVSDLTPTALAISQTPIGPTGFPAPDIARGITADNGMQFNLVGGVSDGTYRSSWSLNPAAVNTIPEPEVWQIFSLGLFVLGLGACRAKS